MEELRLKWVGGLQFAMSVACPWCKTKRKELHLLNLPDNLTERVFCEFTEKFVHMSQFQDIVQGEKEGEAGTLSVSLI